MNRRFTPRQARAIDALMPGQWVKREAMDLSIGSSNAPDVILNLRRKLGDDAIETQMVDGTDRDGQPIKYGRYRLTPAGRKQLHELAANDEKAGE